MMACKYRCHHSGPHPRNGVSAESTMVAPHLNVCVIRSKGISTDGTILWSIVVAPTKTSVLNISTNGHGTAE